MVLKKSGWGAGVLGSRVIILQGFGGWEAKSLQNIQQKACRKLLIMSGLRGFA
jgi:hypothetical protein